MVEKEQVKPCPQGPCWCGSTDWWYREPRMILGQFSPGGWLCAREHPNPNQEVRKEIS